MAHFLNVEHRLSYRYRDAYRNLDTWSDKPIKVKALATSDERQPFPDDPCETTYWTQRFVFDKALDPKDVARAIASTLSRSTCRHDWDCCGCWTTYCRTLATGRGYAVMKFSASRNY